MKRPDLLQKVIEAILFIITMTCLFGIFQMAEAGIQAGHNIQDCIDFVRQHGESEGLFKCSQIVL